MAIDFVCPSCRRTLRVKDSLAGQRGKCPLCHQSIQVPARNEPSPEAYATRDAAPAPPVRRMRQTTARKRKPSPSQNKLPLMVGGIGAAIALVLVILVVVLVVGRGDNGPVAPDPDETRVSEAPARPAQPVSQRVRIPDLDAYVPAETTMAFGASFGDGQAAGANKLAMLATFLHAPISAAGLEPDQVAEVVFACDPAHRHLVAGIRAKVQLNDRDLRKRLGCNDRAEEAGTTPIYAMSAYTGWGPLALALPDDGRTMLVGRAETLKAALTAPSAGGNESVRALDRSAGGSRFWVAAAEMNDQLLRVGHRLLPTTWRFPQGSRDAARAVKSFAASVDFAEKMTVQMHVECRDDEKASQIAGLIDAALTLLENPPKAPKSTGGAGTAGPGAGQGSAAQYNDFYDGVVATSSGQSVANVSQKGPRATIVWETSGTGVAARFAWSFVTAMALAPLSPSAEGEQLFPGPLRRFSSGLQGLCAANHAFPFGAAPRDDVHLLERISWMAQVLPHLGLNDLYQRIDFAADWEDGENRTVASTLVEAFLDPRAQEYRWEGYPFHNLALTHYVGMAGLGRNAAELPADDPRAGIFGYDRSVKLEDVSDGAANTIMLISAGEIYGPWMAPGGATVRGAQVPYFSGMSGFQAPGTQAGAAAAFADGSVRFINADIDPKVFAGMCTIHGND
jgi:hypothetical protein